VHKHDGQGTHTLSLFPFSFLSFAYLTGPLSKISMAPNNSLGHPPGLNRNPTLLPHAFLHTIDPLQPIRLSFSRGRSSPLFPAAVRHVSSGGVYVQSVRRPGAHSSDTQYGLLFFTDTNHGLAIFCTHLFFTPICAVHISFLRLFLHLDIPGNGRISFLFCRFCKESNAIELW
jgi:hypothetical protein